MIFTYDGTAKSQAEFTKNVYKGYLSSAEKRSLPEKLFERYCESSKNIQWFYKNGDKGIEYFLSFIRITLESKNRSIQTILLKQLMVRFG